MGRVVWQKLGGGQVDGDVALGDERVVVRGVGGTPEYELCGEARRRGVEAPKGTEEPVAHGPTDQGVLVLWLMEPYAWRTSSDRTHASRRRLQPPHVVEDAEELHGGAVGGHPELVGRQDAARHQARLVGVFEQSGRELPHRGQIRERSTVGDGAVWQLFGEVDEIRGMGLGHG